MKIKANWFRNKRVPRSDSARDMHGFEQAPFAKAKSLDQLLVDEPLVKPLGSPKCYELIEPEPSEQPNRWSDARQNLEQQSHPADADLAALSEADHGNMVTARYAISAGSASDWKLCANDGNGTWGLSGQKASLMWGDNDSAALNRRGTSTTVACDDSGSSRMALGQDANTTGAGFIQTVGNTAHGTELMRGDLFGAQGVAGVGLSASWVTEAGARLGAGVTAVVVGGTELEPVLWGDAVTQPDGGPRVLTQWTTKIMPVIVCDVGGSMVHIGAGVRASAYRSKQNVYQVYVPAEELSASLQRRRGVRGIAAQLLETLGAKKAPIALPKLRGVLEAKRANFLKVGESVRLVRTANMTGGVSLNIYGVRTGVFFSFTGETEILIARPDDTHLRVTIAPKKIVSVSANIDALVACEIFDTKTFARAMYAEYSVDTLQAEACAAVDALLNKGSYPGSGLGLQRPDDHVATDLNQRVRHEALPKGVRALNMQAAEQLASIIGVSFPKPFFLRGRIAGLGVMVGVTQRRQVTANGDASLFIDSRGRMSERELGPAGKSGKRVDAHLRRLSIYDWRGAADTRFDGLEIELDQTLSRVSGRARAELTTKLSTMFGLGAKPVERLGDKQTYQVKISRTFIHEAIARIRRATKADCLRAAFSSKTNVMELRQLALALASAEQLHPSDPDSAALDSAREIQAFVARGGRRAFAAVHRLAGGSLDDLDVDVSSSAFDKPVRKSLRHQVKYATATRGATLDRAVAEGKKLEQEADRGLLNLKDDAILAATDSEDHTRKVAALHRVGEELKAFNRTLSERRERLQ